jgi:hypothetical protein
LLAIDDFDGDGQLDVSVPARFGQEAVLYGNGDGTFGPPIYYAIASSAWAVATGDFNGDGAPDLAVAVHDGTVAILLNSGYSDRPKDPLSDLAAADVAAFHGNEEADTFAALQAIRAASDVRSPASRAPEMDPVDRFFAALGPNASGLAGSRGRLRTVRILDEVPPWAVRIEDDAEANLLTYHHGM